MKKKLPLLFLGLLMFAGAWAQQKTITGKVTGTEDGEAVPGVTVTVQGTTIATQTDPEGMYEITAEEGQVLVFSFLGMQTVERTVGSPGTIDVSMLEDLQSLEEVVVVGYGTQTKANLTGAVSTVDVEKTLGSRPITDVARGLQGTTPGLSITTPTGEIGTNPRIRLRGVTGSLNSGGAQPLILLDNVEIQNLLMVNPADIESITVLKDAASASIYGTRAAWGVILITTKSGKKGAPNKITYSNNFSIATPTTRPTIASSVEGAEVAFKALQRTDPSRSSFGVVGMFYDEMAIQKMQEWNQQYGGQDLGKEMVMGRDFEFRDGRVYFYRPWDADDMFLKEWSPQNKHNITVSGGGEKTSYHLGLGYVGQSGVLKPNPDRFDRYNLTLGINSSITDWFEARAKVIWSKTSLESPFQFTSATYDPWYYLYRWPRTYPYGTYEGKSFRSAVTEIEQAKISPEEDNMSRISVGGTLNIAEGLTFDADYTYSSTNTHLHQTGGSVTGYNFWAGGGSLNYGPYTSASYDKVEYNSYWEEINTVKAYATYNKAVNDHSFKILAGTDVEVFKNWSQSSERRELIDPDKGEIDLATGDQFVGGARGHWATLGYFGRINYSYKDKYLLELNGRYDGSSFFPTNDQWAFFPSMSAGYIISNEPFMKGVKPVLSFLKIRGSWGTIGNHDVGQYAFLPVMPTASSDWLIGDTEMATIGNPRTVSSVLTWETVTKLDVGMDAAFFNDKLGLTFDWYQRTTSDMHSAGVTLPSSFGAAAPERNFGEMQTTGWELSINWNQTFKNGFYFSATGMLSDFEEKITKYANTTMSLPNPIQGRNFTYYEGMTLGEIWGYETDRFFSKDDFQQDGSGNLLIDDNGHYILKDGIPSQELYEASWFFYGPGDVKYKDLDGDGQIDYGTNTVDDPGDRKVIGNSTPRYEYGLRLDAAWKGFDLGVFIQGVGRRDFWANGPIFVPGYRPGEAWYQHQLDYWTPENQDAYYPRPTDQGQSNESRNFLPQTKYMLDLSYLRMKNITLGYTLPKQISDKLRLQNVRIYLSGENLFEFDNLDIPIDPEVDYTPAGLNDSNTFGRVYPYRRNLSFGLQATL